MVDLKFGLFLFAPIPKEYLDFSSSSKSFMTAITLRAQILGSSENAEKILILARTYFGESVIFLILARINFGESENSFKNLVGYNI